MTTWRPEVEPPPDRVKPAGYVVAMLRGLVLAAVIYGGLVVLLMVRLVERTLAGAGRPVSPWIAQGVCRVAFPILGLGYRVEGRPMAARGAAVANHSSWLDIFALNACQRVHFVSKSAVAGWPGIGWLARATGTVFIDRDPRHAKAQQAEFEARIRAGHRLLFFPEGTSTDGRRVLAFKSTLFAAFYTHGLEHVMRIQPVSVIYHPPPGHDPRHYGWWGDMDFAPHLLKVLATLRRGRVEVIFHDAVAVDAFASRKELAAHCERTVRQAVAARLPGFQD